MAEATSSWVWELDDRISGPLKDVMNRVERLEKQMGQTEQRTNRAFGSRGQKKASGFSSVLSGMGENVRGMADRIPGIGGSLSALAGPAGIAAGAVAGIGAAAAKVASEVVKAGNKMYELRVQTQKLTDLSGQALDDVSTAAATTASVFDATQKDVVKSANTLDKQMGTSYERANKLIRQGFQAGANVGGDFLDQVQEYAPQFEAAGIKADNMISIMSQAKKLGVWTDKLPDAIKEAGTALREGAKPAKDALANAFGPEFATQVVSKVQSGAMGAGQALQNIAAKARKVGLSAGEQQKILTDVFKAAGEDAGPKLLKLMGGLGKSTKSLIDEGRKYVKQNQQLLDATGRLKDATNEIGKVTGPLTKDFKIMWTRAKAWFFEAIKPAVEWVQRLVDKLQSGQGMLGQWGKWLKLIGTLIWEGLQFSFKTIGVQLKIIWNIAKALTWPFRQLFSWIMSMVGGVEGVRKGFDKVQSTIAQAWRWVRSLWSIIKEQVWGVLKDIGAWLQRNFGSTLKSIGQAIMQNIVKPIQKFFKWLWDGLKSLGSGLLESMGINLDQVEKRAQKIKKRENRISKSQANELVGMLAQGQQRGRGGANNNQPDSASNVGGVAAGNEQVRNVTVNINNLVNEIKYVASQNVSTAELERRVSQILTRAVRNSELQLSQG
jgi:hypothetical protein